MFPPGSQVATAACQPGLEAQMGSLRLTVVTAGPSVAERGSKQSVGSALWTGTPHAAPCQSKRVHTHGSMHEGRFDAQAAAACIQCWSTGMQQSCCELLVEFNGKATCCCCCSRPAVLHLHGWRWMMKSPMQRHELNTPNLFTMPGAAWRVLFT